MCHLPKALSQMSNNHNHLREFQSSKIAQYIIQIALCWDVGGHTCSRFQSFWGAFAKKLLYKKIDLKLKNMINSTKSNGCFDTKGIPLPTSEWLGAFTVGIFLDDSSWKGTLLCNKYLTLNSTFTAFNKQKLKVCDVQYDSVDYFQ